MASAKIQQLVLDAQILGHKFPSREIATYLLELRESQSDSAISNDLLHAVDRGILRPRVFSILCPMYSSPVSLAECIHQDKSCLVRQIGIKYFGEALGNSRCWQDAWDAIGGTKGLLDLFEKLSVKDVVLLARVIGRCNRGKVKDQRRQQLVEELVKALLPSKYPHSRLQTRDKRAIQDPYAQMVPSCTSEFIAKLMNDADESNPLYRMLPLRKVLKAHWSLLQERVEEGVFGNGSEKHTAQLLPAFLYNMPPEPGSEPRTSASMQFSSTFLRMRLEDKDSKRWPTWISAAEVFFTLLQKVFRRRLHPEELYKTVALGIEVLKVMPHLKPVFVKHDLWGTIVECWKKAPQQYGKLLQEALRLGLGADPSNIGLAFSQIQHTVPAGLKWPLLRLYCLNVPKRGVDIDTADNLSPMAKQDWPIEVFRALDDENVIRLLRGLLSANPNYSFLRGSVKSIFTASEMAGQKNFNVTLLLTMYQREAEGAEGAVDELRKKSATARDQTQRAHFAVAALFYAIASGSYEIYSATVTWSQRFVRDPLTARTIFALSTIGTEEGVNLLSGIPITMDLALEDVALSVDHANAILMTFHECQTIAKGEPSYSQRDWQALHKVFGDVIRVRVERARKLQQHLQASDGDLYGAIWRGTLEMLAAVGQQSLSQAYHIIERLFDTLTPNVLATTTKTMLDADNKKRGKADREPGDVLIERLSYHALDRLTKGDKPTLARDLVLRTILDRPDASSWHRRLLSIGFMKRLSARDAQDMLLAFATAIGQKLEEQSYVKVDAPSVSLVKVTTVKYLAQLLDNAEFISVDAAVDVLIELFKVATHRDIRIATLESMLGMLNKLCSGTEEEALANPLMERLLSALETVIPVVGSINESRPAKEDDWAEGERGGILPELSSDSAFGPLPPLLELLVNMPRQYSRLKLLRKTFTQRFLLPILERSEIEHRRWLALFIAKYKPDFSLDNLPVVPTFRDFVAGLWPVYQDLVPKSVFERFNEYLIFVSAPPVSLVQFNKRLKYDVDLLGRREVVHWLSTYDKDTDWALQSGTYAFIGMLREESGLVAIRDIQDTVMTHVELLIDNYEHRVDQFEQLTLQLSDPPRNKPFSTLYRHCRPLLERIIMFVERKRSSAEWKDSPYRKPSFLPSVTKLHFWLLPYPGSEGEDQCQIFTSALVELIAELLKANPSKAHHISQSAQTVSAKLRDSERVRVGTAIGGMVSGDNNGSEVLTDVAEHLIQAGERAWRKDEVLHGRMRQMVESWQRSPSEDVRMRAVAMKRRAGAAWDVIEKP